VLDAIAALYNAPDEGSLATRERALRARFEQVEAELAAAPFFAGPAFSLVDAVFAPVFRYFDVIDGWASTHSATFPRLPVGDASLLGGRRFARPWPTTTRSACWTSSCGGNQRCPVAPLISCHERNAMSLTQGEPPFSVPRVPALDSATGKTVVHFEVSAGSRTGEGHGRH